MSSIVRRPSRVLNFIGVFALILNLAACTSDGLYRLGSEPAPSDHAHPDAASYGADSFTYGKKMRIRPANTQKFFSKHCDLTGERAFTSMTAYDCTY